jgi:hypothetical protein
MIKLPAPPALPFSHIRDEHNRFGVNTDTYANTKGRRARALIDYFPDHSFTYGDPTGPKAGLRKLTRGDLLVFYAGLEGWDCRRAPALYIIGYFEVVNAGLATQFDRQEIARDFRNNFHVRHKPGFSTPLLARRLLAV